MLKILIAAIVMGTWNGNWFPSGRAKHRAAREVEDARISEAAQMLSDGLSKIDPEGTNDVILCLNEIRSPAVATNLISKIGRKGLKLAAISRYRWSDRFDQQQDVIATTLPVVDSHWSVWKKKSSVKPPRGYVFTSVVIDGVVTANVYAVHLKSNYGQGKDEKKIEDNRRKRSIAIEQIVEMEKPRRRSFRRPVIVAGDLNADKRRKEFSQDTIFKTLDESGFCDVYLNMPEEERYTTEHRYFGKSAIDYIFYRDFSVCGEPEALAVKNVSDHRALFALLDVNKNIVFEKEKKEN